MGRGIACSALLSAHLLAGAVVPVPARAGRVEVGRLYPAVALPSIDRSRMRSLEEFRGRKVLLIEFASW